MSMYLNSVLVIIILVHCAEPPADCEIEFLTSPYLADEDLPLAVCIRLNGPTNTDVTVMFEAFNAIGDTATGECFS